MDIATHIRIFDADPTDELVQKRQAAIGELAESYKQRSTVDDLLKLADALAAGVAQRGTLPADLSLLAEGAIRKHSPAFVGPGQELQTKVCALLAALTVLGAAEAGGSTLFRTDVLAVGLWSALSFQKPLSESKLERLRSELLQRAAQLSVHAAEKARVRAAIPDTAFAVPDAEGFAGIAKNWGNGPRKVIDALRLNAALDREELDFLWWALRDWSDLLKCRISDLDAATGALTSGIEAAAVLRRLPASAHKHLVFRQLSKRGSHDLASLIATIGDRREGLAVAHTGNALLGTCTSVFPLLTAIGTSQAKASGSKEVRTTDEWAARALLEAGILRIAALPTAFN